MIVFEGALPGPMSTFIATVAPTLLSDDVLSNFLGQIFRRMGLFSFKGCRMGSWGCFDLMEQRTLGCFKTGTDVGVLPRHFRLGNYVARIELNNFRRGSYLIIFTK